MLAVVWVVFGLVSVPAKNRVQPIIQRRMMRGRSIMMKTRFRIFFSSVEMSRLRGIVFVNLEYVFGFRRVVSFLFGVLL